MCILFETVLYITSNNDFSSWKYLTFPHRLNVQTRWHTCYEFNIIYGINFISLWRIYSNMNVLCVTSCFVSVKSGLQHNKVQWYAQRNSRIFRKFKMFVRRCVKFGSQQQLIIANEWWLLCAINFHAVIRTKNVGVHKTLLLMHFCCHIQTKIIIPTTNAYKAYRKNTCSATEMVNNRRTNGVHKWHINFILLYLMTIATRSSVHLLSTFTNIWIETGKMN